MAAKKSSSDAMEFILSQLRKNPKAEYKTIREGATKKGYTIYPIMYGRAKSLLGLVEVAPRGSKKKKKKAAKKRAATRRSAGAAATARRRRAGAPSPIDSLQEMIGAMKELERERDRYRKVLDQIAQLIDQAS